MQDVRTPFERHAEKEKKKKTIFESYSRRLLGEV
jgi:Txe/YoeB family toxin of Txe-Axe toxin-antitoxin module